MGRPKKVSKKRKRSSDADNEKEEAISNTATCTPTLVADDMVECDILRRLPVKSLMRFKCVSKHWCSLIKDPYFIDLHFRTSKTPACLLFLIPRQRKKIKSAGISYQKVCFKTADLLSEVTGRAVPSIHNIMTSKSFEFSDVLGAINGLICFTNKFEDSVSIYNISTREVMPLVKSTSRDNVIRVGKNYLIYSFGFDPVTKQYKVICNWRVDTKNGNQISVGHFWEVLTFGTSSWRRIEEIPSIPDGLTSSSIYVNGSIYWFPEQFQKGNWNFGDTVCIMAFDVGSEKFRKIQIPQFIVDQSITITYFVQDCARLQEVNGCLAILRRTDDYTVKLWIHEGTGDENWNEQIILLPGCLYKGLFPTVFFFHSITGTDQLILEIHQTESCGNKKFMSLFTYNWQDRTFEKLKISGIPSSATVCTSFIESLISLPGAEMKQPMQPSTAEMKQPIPMQPSTAELEQPMQPSTAELEQPMQPSTAELEQPMQPSTAELEQPMQPSTEELEQPIPMQPASTAELEQPMQPSTAFDSVQHPIQRNWRLLTFLWNFFRLSG